MHDPHLKLYIYIAVERTVSQIFDKGPSSFSIKFRKNYSKIYIKSYSFFCINLINKKDTAILARKPSIARLHP